MIHIQVCLAPDTTILYTLHYMCNLLKVNTCTKGQEAELDTRKTLFRYRGEGCYEKVEEKKKKQAGVYAIFTFLLRLAASLLSHQGQPMYYLC